MWRLGLAAVLLLALVGCGRHRTADKYLQEGFSDFQQQDYDQAIKNYEQAIALGARSPGAYNMLGLAYRFKYQRLSDPGLQESEIIAFQKAVESTPNIGRPWLIWAPPLFPGRKGPGRRLVQKGPGTEAESPGKGPVRKDDRRGRRRGPQKVQGPVKFSEGAGGDSAG